MFMRLTTFGLTVCLLFAFAGCSPSSSDAPVSPTPSAPPPSGYLPFMQIALDAQEDLYENFWDYDYNHIKLTFHGYKTGGGRQQMIWEHAIKIFSMYTLWFALDDNDVVKADITGKLAGQWEFMKKNFTHEQLTANFSDAPNIAVDDSGWGAMVYMIMYHITGDTYALEVCRELIAGAYEYWKDGDTRNGLWYSQNPPSQGGGEETRFKSMSSVGLMYAALEYTLVTGDHSLLEDTLNVYNWTEENMLRGREVTYENGLTERRFLYHHGDGQSLLDGLQR